MAAKPKFVPFTSKGAPKEGSKKEEALDAKQAKAGRPFKNGGKISPKRG